MKSVCRLSFLAAAAALFCMGCEPHTFEETSILHKGHGGHDDGHGGGHGDHEDGHDDGHHDEKDDHHADEKGHGHDDEKTHQPAPAKEKAAPAKEEPREVGI